VLLKFEGRAEGDAGRALGFQLKRDFFIVVFGELGLGVEGVDLRGATVHEEMDDGLGRAFGLRSTGGKGANCLTAERRNGEGAEAHAAALQEFAAGFDKAAVAKVVVSVHDALIDVEEFVA